MEFKPHILTETPMEMQKAPERDFHSGALKANYGITQTQDTRLQTRSPTSEVE